MNSSIAESKCLFAAARLFSGCIEDETTSYGPEIKSNTRNSISNGKASNADMIFDVVLEAQIIAGSWGFG